MDLIIKIIFPIILIVGAIYLTLAELIAYNRLKTSGNSPAKSVKVRVARRLTGATIVIIVAVMIFYGLIFMPAPAKENYHNQAIFWVVVLFLVFISICLAVWDVFESIKLIERISDRSTLEDMKKLEMHLQKEIAKAREDKENKKPGSGADK